MLPEVSDIRFLPCRRIMSKNGASHHQKPNSRRLHIWISQQQSAASTTSDSVSNISTTSPTSNKGWGSTGLTWPRSLEVRSARNNSTAIRQYYSPSIRRTLLRKLSEMRFCSLSHRSDGLSSVQYLIFPYLKIFNNHFKLSRQPLSPPNHRPRRPNFCFLSMMDWSCIYLVLPRFFFYMLCNINYFISNLWHRRIIVNRFIIRLRILIVAERIPYPSQFKLIAR